MNATRQAVTAGHCACDSLGRWCLIHYGRKAEREQDRIRRDLGIRVPPRHDDPPPLATPRRTRHYGREDHR